jgi:type I restriction enzyme S subunit
MENTFNNTTFSNFVTLQRGFDLPKQDRDPGVFPVVASTSVQAYHSEYKVKPPGVVTGRSGSLGSVQYLEKPFWPLNTTLWVKDFKGNDPKFVFYFLQTLGLERYNSGAGVPTLNRNHLDGLDVAVPPFPTQRKIAAILSAYDDLIENNLRRIKILEAMAQNLYREWFVKFRFPGHQHARFTDSPIGMIPGGWQVKVMPDAVTIRPALPVPKNEQVPFVSMGSLSEASMLISETEYRPKASGARFQNGDTLFARITPCLENGKTGFVQFLPTSDTVACGSTEFIVLRSKTVCPEYVYLMARSDLFRDNAIKSMSGATGRQRVREECFDQFLLAQPPDAILERFQMATRPQFEMIHSLNRRNQVFRHTRDLLLPRLISGEVDVSALDIAVPEEADA